MDILISGGRIIDPGSYEGPGDILVTDGQDCRRPPGEPLAAPERASTVPVPGQGY